MKIIRFFVIPLALLTCLCSCQKNDNMPEEGGLVQFATATYALQVKDDPFPTTSDIGAFAWKSAEAWASAASLTPFMTNVQAVYDNTDHVWKPTTTYKWPTSGNLHFLCYSPYSATSPFSWDATDGLSVSSYTIPEGGSADLCYSDIAINQTRESDDDDPDPASILIRHALCKVSFNVEAADAPAGLSVVSVAVSNVTVTLSNIKNSGSFAAANAAGGTWSGAAWSGQSGTAGYTYDSSHNGFILMPQTLTNTGSGDQQFTITYTATVTYINADTLAETEIEFTKTETHPLFLEVECESWGVNQHIVYNIKINLFEGEITFTPTHTDWEDTTATMKIGYENPEI